mmetsp:Transcript_39514/g.87919  ORF Transcript_39514/g.87919 Transcript_39514/m.87919 type:complete len:259 (+) Transcript_39514:1197-1973(+)
MSQRVDVRHTALLATWVVRPRQWRLGVVLLLGAVLLLGGRGKLLPTSAVTSTPLAWPLVGAWCESLGPCVEVRSNSPPPGLLCGTSPGRGGVLLGSDGQCAPAPASLRPASTRLLGRTAAPACRRPACHLRVPARALGPRRGGLLRLSVGWWVDRGPVPWPWGTVPAGPGWGGLIPRRVQGPGTLPGALRLLLAGRCLPCLPGLRHRCAVTAPAAPASSAPCSRASPPHITQTSIGPCRVCAPGRQPPGRSSTRRRAA